MDCATWSRLTRQKLLEGADNRAIRTRECGYFDLLGFVRSCWRRPLARDSVRLAAQKKRECKQQRREGAVEKNGVGIPKGDHGPTIASVRSGYKRLIQITPTAALCLG